MLTPNLSIHEKWMSFALSLAETAASIDEVPVGAIIIKNNKIISTGFNQKESSQSVTKHAEIIAIEAACKKLGSWRLNDCTLYVTLEPCMMCSGAIYQARLTEVIYGCSDPKGGCLGSLYSINTDDRLNHSFEVTKGVYGSQASELLQKFFKRKRTIKNELAGKNHSPS